MVAVGWRVGVGVLDFGRGFGFLNEKTFKLEREEQKKRATCKSTFFPAIFSFFERGPQENSRESLSQGVLKIQKGRIVEVIFVYKRFSEVD